MFNATVRDRGFEQLKNGVTNIVKGHGLDTVDASYLEDHHRERLDAIGSAACDTCDAITGSLMDVVDEGTKKELLLAIVSQLADEQLDYPILDRFANHINKVRDSRLQRQGYNS